MTKEWQSMETAPKDGSEVLLFVPTLNRRVWIGSYNVHESHSNGKLTSRFEGWDFGIFESCFPMHDPTHWMPLPPAPDEVT